MNALFGDRQKLTAANAAARLGLAEETVRTHLKHMYVKLGVGSRAELIFELHQIARASVSLGLP